jgi:hypothetical protein
MQQQQQIVKPHRDGHLGAREVVKRVVALLLGGRRGCAGGRGVAVQVAFEANFVKSGYHIVGSRVETETRRLQGTGLNWIRLAQPPPRRLTPRLWGRAGRRGRRRRRRRRRSRRRRRRWRWRKKRRTIWGGGVDTQERKSEYIDVVCVSVCVCVRACVRA